MDEPPVRDRSLPHQIIIRFGYADYLGTQVPVVQCNCGWYGGHGSIEQMKRWYEDHLAADGLAP